MQVVFFVVWIIAVFAIFGRGLDDLAGIVASVRWLKQKVADPNQPSEEPFIAIVLPVLREQQLIIDTMQVFAQLKYPLERLRIFVVTTEKEIFQREQARHKLKSLATDIAGKRLPTSLLVEKYLGVFPEHILKEVILAAEKKHGEAEVYHLLSAAFDTCPSTIDLVKEQVSVINGQAGVPLYTHLHYPGSSGDMNQQLEYALQQLPHYIVAQDIDRERAYIAIYNADSRPHADTLHTVARLCESYFEQHSSYPPALQQSAIFLENVNRLGSKVSSLLLQAAAILQTRWVLSHEIPRLRRQSYSAVQFKQHRLGIFQRFSGAEFALCVGHGLFLRYDQAEQLGLFSINAVCDDLLWSLHLCIQHIPILPVPVLESAETPSAIKSLLIQRRSWFLGYTEYPQARKALVQSGNSNKLTLELVTWHALLRAFMWMLLSPSIFVAFMLPIVARSWVEFLITLTVYTVYGFLSYWMTLKELTMLKSKSGGSWHPASFSRKRKIFLILYSLPTFLIESVGLWWCIFQRIGWAIMRQPVYKQKTER